MSPKDSPAMDDAAVTRWDRPRWISVFSSHNPTIREVTECLGLGLSASSSTTNRGIPKFDNPDYRKLSSEVTRLSKELPKERDALLDFAADPHSLDKELEELLATFGPAIWGRDTDRTCLLTPDPAKKTYPKDLFYEDPEDKEILKIHLHRWIIIKACYYIRNMKLKRPSAANDYDTLADIEADGDPMSPIKTQLSPNGTSKSITPPVDGPSAPDVKPVGGKKRKSSVFMSHSDGEEMGATPAKRPYQSHTMPLSRKSPRKSLKSITGDSPISENIPPVPIVASNHVNGLHPSGAAHPAEASRPLLTPLSSNDLNGTARPPSTTPAAGGFTAVNTGGSFTAVNATPPIRESPPQKPLQPNTHNYSSPYDSSPYGAGSTQNGQHPPKAPPLNTTTPVAHGFQAINSPVVANGVSARNSPIVQHNSHAHLPSQHPPQVLPKSTSRSNTPVNHHNHRPSLNHQRTSRSNTPIAPATAVQPAHATQPPQLAPTPNVIPAQPTPAPSIQAGPAPPTHPAPAPHVQPTLAPRVHHAPIPVVPSAPSAIQYAPQPQPVLKSHPIEAAPMPPQPASNLDLSLLQCEVLGSVMQYLFPKATSPPDEAVLLHKMESLWHLGKPIFVKQIGSLYDLQTRVLLSWITERRKIAQLRHALSYAPGVPTAEMVDRLLAMNDLRVMRLKWKNMSSADGLSAEDLLCRTLAVMTNTEGTEYLFKDGLDRLNELVFDFLRNEDMRILMHKR